MLRIYSESIFFHNSKNIANNKAAEIPRIIPNNKSPCARPAINTMPGMTMRPNMICMHRSFCPVIMGSINAVKREIVAKTINAVGHGPVDGAKKQIQCIATCHQGGKLTLGLDPTRLSLPDATKIFRFRYWL